MTTGSATAATQPGAQEIGGYPTGFARTVRTDNWWVGPFLTVLGLGGFVVYTTWRIFAGDFYWADPYLSPLFSPLLWVNANPEIGGWAQAPIAHAWFSGWPLPAWWPAALPASPALFILAFPGSFRLTCYYYRKSYYRSFMGSPPGCAVCPIAAGNYRGETRLFLFQNLHRYALYFAIYFVAVLYWDSFLAFFKTGADGQKHLGVGVGTLVLFLNATLIAAYTFGCHSWRHLVGGRLDRFAASGKPTAPFKIWKRSTWLNERHMLFAWLSLIWVGFTDFYVYAVSKHWIVDLNTWGN